MDFKIDWHLNCHKTTHEIRLPALKVKDTLKGQRINLALKQLENHVFTITFNVTNVNHDNVLLVTWVSSPERFMSQMSKFEFGYEIAENVLSQQKVCHLEMILYIKQHNSKPS